MPVRYIMSKEEIKSMTLRQIAIEKERIEYGEHIIRERERWIPSNQFIEALAIASEIKDKLKLRELELLIQTNKISMQPWKKIKEK